jgi:hypothetical protein
VLEDGAAAPDARAAAALALHRIEHARPRLRAVADEVASKGMRAVLERAIDAESEDAALDSALANVSKH